MTPTPIDLRPGIAAVLKPLKKRYPAHVNRISALDDPCLRRLYYMRHDWEQAEETDDGLQGIFQTGNILEPVIERIISEIGASCVPPIRIVGTQMATRDDLLEKYQIGGTIDGLLQTQIDGQWLTAGVLDTKTMSPNTFRAIDGYADLSRYPWTRKYRGQLMLYALAHNLESCFILMVNKTNLYDIKITSFPVDMAYCEGLLSKAQQVNEALEFGEPPEGIEDPDACPKCPWFSFCAPDLKPSGNLEIIDNDELAAVLDRLEELSPAAEEIADLEKQRDAMLTKGQDVACGGWMVLWNRSEQHRKAQAEHIVEVWRKKISKMG